MYRYLFVVALFLFVDTAKAEFVPDSFKHFYKYDTHVITFVLPNDNYYETKTSSNYYEVDKIYDLKGFYSALISSGIKKDKVELVAKSITNDINNDNVTVDYSYDNNSLKVSVSADYMSEDKGEVLYTHLKPDTNAIFINNRLYSNYYGDVLNSTLNSTMIAGLGRGYIESDTSLFLNSDEVNFDINNLKYELNLEGHALKMGFGSYGVVKDNSTSIMDYSHSRDSYYISLSSSDNLLSVNDLEQKKMFVDLKSSGTVSIIRDGNTIFSQSYPKGQHAISYSQLPKGNYNVEIKIRADGYPEESRIRRVNNNVSRTGHKGYDYNISLIQSDYDTYQDTSQLVYAEASVTKSFISDELLLGVNSRSDGSSIDLGAAAYYSNENVSSGLYYNIIPDGVFYQSSLSLLGLSLDYENLSFDNNIELDPLVAAVYGQQSYNQWSLSYSVPLWSGNLAFFGSKLHRDSSLYRPGYGGIGRPNWYNSIYNNRTHYSDGSYNNISSIINDRLGDYSGEMDSTNISVNYQTYFSNNISIDVGYSLTVNDNVVDNRDGVFSIYFSMPLGEQGVSYSGGYESSSRTNGRITNSIDYQEDDFGLFSSVDTNGNASINSYIDGEQSEVSVSGNINASNNQFRSSSYVNLSNKNNSNVAVSLESTSVISGSGVSQTKDFYESYLAVESEGVSTTISDSDDLGVVSLQVNNGSHFNSQILGHETFIGLNEFNSYKYNVDNEISGYQVSNSSDKKGGVIFSYPGTIHNFSNKVEEIISFLTYFEDFNDRSLNNIKCLGEGCVSTTLVGDGVYSISLIKDQPFKIVSNNQFCYVETGELNRGNTQNKCFPNITANDDGIQVVTSGLGDDSETIYYLGELNKDIPDEIIISLRDVDIEYIEYKFARGIHLFARVNKNQDDDGTLLTLKQMNIIDELQSYVRNSHDDDDFAIN